MCSAVSCFFFRHRPQEEGEEGELIEDTKKETDAIPGLDLIGTGIDERKY